VVVVVVECLVGWVHVEQGVGQLVILLGGRLRWVAANFSSSSSRVVVVVVVEV
jgi:hypothetical protein